MYVYSIVAILVTLGIWHFRNFYSFYRRGRKLQLPILLTPINPGIAYTILGGFSSPLVQFLLSLRTPIFKFLQWTAHEYYWPTGLELHEKYGPAYVVVSPKGITLVVADPEAALEVLARWKEFRKNEDGGGVVDMFGKNVLTVNGAEWQRHRRITATALNKNTHEHVWKVALDQAKSMLRVWERGADVIANIKQDTMTLALDVLTATGFGKSYTFETGVSQIGTRGHEITLQEALELMITSIPSMVLLTILPIPHLLLPSKLKQVKAAIQAYQGLMNGIWQEDKMADEDKIDGKWMGTFLRASEAVNVRNRLNDREILGNCFIYTLAGGDTVANNLSYAISLLSIFPRWQDWIREEIREIFGDAENVEWHYEGKMAKLKRCLAVQYETLRLFGQGPTLVRFTPNTYTSLKIGGNEYTLPPKTTVAVNSAVLGTLPSVWGPDSLVFRPDRFIKITSSNGLTQEEFVTPEPGVFLHWAGGPRICPGKKFSQVEFAATIATLLHKHRVEPKMENGETMEAARERTRKVIYDSAVIGPTLSMKHPEKITLVWREV